MVTLDQLLLHDSLSKYMRFVCITPVTWPPLHVEKY